MLAKVAVSAGILVLLFTSIDLAAALDRMTGARPDLLVAAVMALALQLALSGWRWHRVLRGLDERPPAGTSLALTWLGQFLNQGFPSVIAGDAARVWFMRPRVERLGSLVTSVIVDRVTGFFAIVGLIVCAMPWLLSRLPDGAAGPALVTVTIAVITGLAGLWLLSNLAVERYIHLPRLLALHRHLQSGRRVFSRPAGLLVAMLAVAVQVLSVFAVVAIAGSLQIRLDLGDAFLFVPAVMLLTMMPITIAGWGVREGAMVVALGMADVVATDAAAIAILLGLLTVATALPGGLILLHQRLHAREMMESVRG